MRSKTRREVLVLSKMPRGGRAREILQEVLKNRRTLVIVKPNMAEMLPLIQEALLHGDGHDGLGIKVETLGREGPMVIAPGEVVLKRRRDSITMML